MKDITGQRFGRLTAIRFSHNPSYYWIFKCDCGVVKTICKSSVIRGRSQSCGCLKKELVKTQKITHGMTHSRFYKIWGKMNHRCKNKHSKDFNLYGGRGIKCLWKSFEKFKDDMYESYLKHYQEFGEKNTTIDRIDNDGNYCKENCQWATQKEQARNRRSSIIVSFNGQKKLLIELAYLFCINYGTVRSRLNYGWSVKDSLTKRVRR